MKIKQKIEDWIKENLDREDGFALMHPKDFKNGDYTLIVSENTAEDDFNLLSKNKIKEVENITLVKPRFINFYLSKEFFAESVKEILDKKDDYGKNNLLEDQRIIIEHTQPNPFKEFHIGHLMNNAIGESIVRIVKANKAEVKTASYHGDKGLHIAKAVWAMQKGIEYEKAYAYGNKAYEEDENAKQEITALNKTIYEGKVAKIWKISDEGFNKFKNYFQEICKKLDTTFDYQFWETASG